MVGLRELEKASSASWCKQTLSARFCEVGSLPPIDIPGRWAPEVGERSTG